MVNIAVIAWLSGSASLFTQLQAMFLPIYSQGLEHLNSTRNHVLNMLVGILCLYVVEIGMILNVMLAGV